MIQLKPHAKLTFGAHRVQPEILFAISVAETIFERFGLTVSVVALLEGHSNHHLLGYEVDFAVPPDQLEELVIDLQASLLDSFVVRPDVNRVHVVFAHE